MTALSIPPATMTEEKKSYMKRFKKGVQALFNKETKKSAKNETPPQPKIQARPPITVTPVATLLERFDKLKLENEIKNNEKINANDELSKFSIKTIKCDDKNPVKNEVRNDPVSSTTLLENFDKLKVENEIKNNDIINANDELSKFSIKTIKCDDKKPVKTDVRNSSVSSNDSGFSDKVDSAPVTSDIDETSDLVESLDDLKIDDKKKCKKTQTVYIARGPVKNKFDHNALSHPYNQVNRTFLSGGTVIQNDVDSFEETPGTDLQQIAEQLIGQRSFDDTDLLNLLNTNEATEIEKSFDIKSLIPPTEVTNYNVDILSDFQIPKDFIETYPISPTSNENVFSPQSLSPNASFYPSPPYQNMCSPNPLVLSSYVHHGGFGEDFNQTEVSPQSNYSLCSDSYLKTDDEEQNTLEAFEESNIPSSVFDSTEEVKERGAETPKHRERVRSTSSMTMKQYKTMQNELAADFAKRDCCLESTKDSSRDFFRDHFMKLEAEKRKNLCLQVAKLELLTEGLGVLHNIIIDAPTKQEEHGLLFALFGLICERVLAEQPALFLQDFGQSLVKASALRCPSVPMLTRHVVRCVRIALMNSPRDVSEPIFKETDSRGDTLLSACARRGDACADVLAELVRRDDGTPPLFDVAHVNAEGHSALHLACLSHGARSCLHVVHVLIAHGQADLYQGDIKGGDTALHLAVNSVNCDLKLVMTLFKHHDRKLWKRLAHYHNRSSVSPLEYARSATKASTRHNYPEEVLNFLKKCR